MNKVFNYMKLSLHTILLFAPWFCSTLGPFWENV